MLDKCLWHLRSWYSSLFCTFRSAPAAKGHQQQIFDDELLLFQFLSNEAKCTSEGLRPIVENMSLCFRFSLVQCRMVQLCMHGQARECAPTPHPQTFPKRCHWNGSGVGLNDGPSCSFQFVQGRSSIASSFDLFYVLGFVSAVAVSSSSTHHIFRATHHLWWLLSCYCYCHSSMTAIVLVARHVNVNFLYSWSFTHRSGFKAVVVKA